MNVLMEDPYDNPSHIGIFASEMKYQSEKHNGGLVAAGLQELAKSLLMLDINQDFGVLSVSGRDTSPSHKM